MVHCPEWEDLFKKRPDACVESADYRRKVERWLDTLDEIRKRGIQVTTKIFPEGAHRVLLNLDDAMREKTLNYICHKLERGEKITAPDLKKSIAVWEGKEASTSCPVRKNNTNELSPAPDNEVKPPEAPIAKTLKEKILSGKEVHIPIGPAQPPAMKQTAQPAASPFSRASGNPPTPAVTDDQRSPKLNRYPLLSKSEWYGATSDFIDSCLSERYHRVISDIREAKPQRYPTPLDVICAGLEKMAESLQDGA